MYTDLCDVQPRSTTDQAYGSKETYGAVVTDVRCRYAEKQMRGLNGITNEWLTTTVSLLLVPYSSDIDEGAKVSNIRLGDGTVIDGNYQVDAGALNRRGRMHRHRSLRLKRVS